MKIRILRSVMVSRDMISDREFHKYIYVNAFYLLIIINALFFINALLHFIY